MYRSAKADSKNVDEYILSCPASLCAVACGSVRRLSYERGHRDSIIINIIVWWQSDKYQTSHQSLFHIASYSLKVVRIDRFPQHKAGTFLKASLARRIFFCAALREVTYRMKCIPCLRHSDCVMLWDDHALDWGPTFEWLSERWPLVFYKYFYIKLR